MSKNQFFKPTALYKEYMILDLIEKNKDITQREIAFEVRSAVSLINEYLDEYEQKGLIKMKRHSTKTVEYFVTKKGKERRKVLNIWYLKSSHEVYLSAKDNIIKFLNQIVDKGFKKILLYGAGEVAEIMLNVISNHQIFPLQVLAVIDDDKLGQDQTLVNKKIIYIDQIKSFSHDGILISSYKHHEKIKEKLLEINYPSNKIIEFFY